MLWISGGFTYLGTLSSLLNMRESPMAGIVLRRWPNHQLDFNGKVFTGAYDNLCHFLCLYKVSNWRHHISFKAPLTLLIPVTNNRVTCWCHQTWRNEFRDDFSSELKLHSPTSSNNPFFLPGVNIGHDSLHWEHAKDGTQLSDPLLKMTTFAT